MKIECRVKDITKDDLINLFSMGLHTNFSLDYDAKDYKPLRDEDDCFEDKLAKVLLDGKAIIAADTYAEDETEFYGSLEHEWIISDVTMEYRVTLEDVRKGIEKAINEPTEDYQREAAMNLINEDGIDFDSSDASLLLQIIVFGEEIYG